jgi:hypothetical protein
VNDASAKPFRKELDGSLGSLETSVARQSIERHSNTRTSPALIRSPLRGPRRASLARAHRSAI